MEENIYANDIIESLKKQIGDLSVAVAYRDAAIKNKDEVINNLSNEIKDLQVALNKCEENKEMAEEVQ